MKRFVLALSVMVMAAIAANAALTLKDYQVTKQQKQEFAQKQAVITMANGSEIVIEFYHEDAPNTVANFVDLINKKYYDGLTFHRVIPGFVAQGGDPIGNGTGGPGYTIKAEFNKKPHLKGTVAMARSQHPDSAGSQFYICLASQPHLDGNYTVFGQVIRGMEAVEAIKVGDTMKTVRVVSKDKSKKSE